MLSTGVIVGTAGRRHLASVMDELAVVEPHGPDRIVATTTRRRSPALVAVMGRMRGDDSGALERAPARRRHARGHHDLARRLRCMGAEPSLPSDRRALRARRIPRPFVEPNHPPMATKRPSSFVCITRAGLTASVALGLTSVFAGGPWLFAALAAAIAPHALLAWADRRKLASYVAIAMVLGGAFLFTLVAVEPHTTNSGIPTSETFSSYFRECATRPTCCGPRSSRSRQRAARCCSPSSRSGSPARSRSGRAAASTRHSARSDRASSSSSRSPRSARAAGCCTRSCTRSRWGCICSRCTRRR